MTDWENTNRRKDMARTEVFGVTNCTSKQTKAAGIMFGHFLYGNTPSTIPNRVFQEEYQKTFNEPVTLPTICLAYNNVFWAKLGLLCIIREAWHRNPRAKLQTIYEEFLPPRRVNHRFYWFGQRDTLMGLCYVVQQGIQTARDLHQEEQQAKAA